MACMITTFLLLSMGTMLQTDALNGEDAYYHDLCKQWDGIYEEIPEKSVVIFSDLDFRSSYYRPDVIGGEIRPEESFAVICEKYYGSDYVCIKKENVEIMLESGEYEPTMAAKMEEAVKKLQDNQEYAIISLHF